MRDLQTADAVRDALPLQTVADMVRTLSAALSEADGAGPAGYLSEIQCTQVAFLVYDSTVGFIVHHFEGRVDRFKLAMAVIFILASKGTVHARAIRSKIDARRQARPVMAIEAPEAAGNGTAAHAGIPVPVPSAYEETYRQALARQGRIMPNLDA